MCFFSNRSSPAEGLIWNPTGPGARNFFRGKHRSSCKAQRRGHRGTERRMDCGGRSLGSMREVKIEGYFATDQEVLGLPMCVKTNKGKHQTRALSDCADALMIER